MPSAIISGGLTQRVLRRKFTSADFVALTEKSAFGSSNGTASTATCVPCKGYGTVRFSVGGTVDQAFTLKTYQRPEKNVASGSTSYAFNTTSSQSIGPTPTTPPTPVNIVGDHLDVTITPGAAVFTSLELEITLIP